MPPDTGRRSLRGFSDVLFLSLYDSIRLTGLEVIYLMKHSLCQSASRCWTMSKGATHRQSRRLRASIDASTALQSAQAFASCQAGILLSLEVPVTQDAGWSEMLRSGQHSSHKYSARRAYVFWKRGPNSTIQEVQDEPLLITKLNHMNPYKFATLLGIVS
jgi:hypothetical protein